MVNNGDFATPEGIPLPTAAVQPVCKAADASALQADRMKHHNYHNRIHRNYSKDASKANAATVTN